MDRQLRQVENMRSKLRISGYEHPTQHVGASHTAYQPVRRIVEDIQACNGEGCVAVGQRKDVPNIAWGKPSQGHFRVPGRSARNPYQTTAQIKECIGDDCPVPSAVVEDVRALDSMANQPGLIPGGPRMEEHPHYIPEPAPSVPQPESVPSEQQVPAPTLSISDFCLQSRPCQHAVSINGQASVLMSAPQIANLLLERGQDVPQHFLDAMMK